LRVCPTIIGEGDQDLAVSRTDRRVVAVREIEPLPTDADVVDYDVEIMLGDHVADIALNTGQQLLGLFYPGAGWRAHVQSYLPRVYGRKEILPDERHEKKARQDAAEEQRRCPLALTHDAGERAIIRASEAFEPALKVSKERWSRASMFRLQRVLHQRRHQCPRQEVRRQHRENHGLGQRSEQEPGDASQGQNRDEDNADAERRDERRYGDLHGAIQNGLFQVFALRRVPMDVLDRDRGVVHKNADGQREPAQRHAVDRLPQCAQHDDRRENGERDRHRHDERAAPAAEK
jgi:hypothetical protein